MPDYTEDALDRRPEVLVDDDVLGDGTAGHLFVGTDPEAFGDGTLVVATCPQALGLDGAARRKEQDQHRVGKASADLARALQVDLEDDVAPGGRVGDRRPVQVPDELRPLEETAGMSVRQERLTIDEDIGVGVLARPRPARRPRPAQPQRGVRLDEAFGDRSLSRPSRAGDDEDQERVVSSSNRPL